MRMKKRGMAEPKRGFRDAAPAPLSRGHLSGVPPQPKRAVNLSVDAELLKVAKDMHVNLSSILEAALREITEEERIRRWRTENKEVVDSYNAYVERNGVLGEELLDFDEPPV